MTRHANLIGETHGHLVVVGKTRGHTRDAYWVCRCVCGNERVAITNDLRRGKVISCGCIKTPYFQSLDITGQKFGRLTALNPTGASNSSGSLWRCRCDCGNHRTVAAGELRAERKTQCVPCVKRQQIEALKIHGCSRPGSKGYDIFKIWDSLLERCYNANSPVFKDYGGRGIFVCERWKSSFEKFRDDMGPRPPKHSVERVDNDGPYDPSNCIWADFRTQNSNKRNSLAIPKGSGAINAKDYAISAGIDPEWMYRFRKRHSLSVEDAVAFMLAHGKRSRVSPHEWLASRAR